MKKIGLLGGSFDPIHKAHISIALKAIEEFDLDEVQLIPTKNNPWKNQSFVSCEDRINMIRIAIAEYPKIQLNTVEIDNTLEELNYTIDTIDFLTQQSPDTNYYYIVGMDQANLFYKWKEAKTLSQKVQLIAFQRDGYERDESVLESYHFKELNNEPIHASSTEIRNGHLHMLDSEVLKYISHHGLYLETMIKDRMKDKRWKHTCSVANLAKEIAISNHLDGRQAYVAGMLHDVAKEMPYDDSLKIMQESYAQYVDKPVPIWHQWISAYVAKNEFLIEEQEILDAIEFHTTGHIPMPKIAKCVYVADKLDPLRGYDSSKQIEICKEDIDQGFRDALIDFYEFSKKNNRDIDDCFFEIYDYFVVKGEE